MSGAGTGLARSGHWALLFGNFVIGCGVMVVAGSLNDLTRSLHVSVALAGQLITAAAVVMAVGAPVLAAVLSAMDRRRLLAWALLWYAAGHALSAFMPDLASLLPVRALSMLAAAIFTPQAAAAIGWLSPPEQRGRAITFVFLGWSVASVLGMPLHSFIGEAFGWRWAFGLVAVLALLGAAWVWRAIPDGVRPPALSWRAWADVLTHPVLMAVVLVTALSGAGQFTLFSYMAPYYRQVLHANAAEISLLFGWFGAFGLMGNVWLSHRVDRLGAGRVVGWTLVSMLVTLLLWPLATNLGATLLVLVPWAVAGFATNSAQQARLGAAAPTLAPALMSLNTSAIYLGQAIGAGGGGVLVAANLAAGRSFHTGLNWVGAAWLLAGTGLSLWALRRMQRDPAHI